ncbi:hypothetical protein LC613_06695 [Nostoc sphaeroides CHAB 2801]|uniref:hypothetical protein n=1 Tax=Nostoc sphaeroides TaxID=446679 RepID=UPI0015F302EE|nr:hypothetical protein [Nostoc sphaeroides]MCC5627840.1 hypothetical protein [Nostoc sphaeroides CHAB 2801]
MDLVSISAHPSQAIFDTFSFSAICYPSMGILKYFLRINLKDQNAMSTTGYAYAHSARVGLWCKSVLITGYCSSTGTICWQ